MVQPVTRVRMVKEAEEVKLQLEGRLAQTIRELPAKDYHHPTKKIVVLPLGIEANAILQQRCFCRHPSPRVDRPSLREVT